MLTLRLLCLTLVGTRGYMLTSSWLALRVPAPAPARLAVASPSMGFFDVFKDPAEYEVIQAQQAVNLAEASDVATIVEIKAARLRLAEATAAVGERKQLRAEQREQRKEADARSGAWRDDALVAKMGGSAASGAPPKEQAQVVRSIAELERRARQTSGIQLAEERLDKAVAEVAKASDQRAALNNLRREVDLARAENVGRGAPMMAKALSLLGLMESATGGNQRTEVAQQEEGSLDAINAAIFGGGYAMPGLDDLDD